MEMTYMSANSFEAASLLASLALAQQENNIVVCTRLIKELNDLQVLQSSQLNLEAMFNPHWSIINDAFFLIVNTLDGFADRDLIIFRSKLFKATNSGKPEAVSQFVRESLQTPEIFSRLTLSAISGLMGSLLQFNLLEEMTMLGEVMHNLSVERNEEFNTEYSYEEEA